MKKQKRVAAVHDISCFGRCSLTVALPIISAAGLDPSVVPTAILSTHTGGFENYTFRDLTEDIMPIVEHWKSLNFEFDAFYSGYLGSFEQLDIVGKLFDELKTNNSLIFIDPVMADNGKLYAGFPNDFPKGMRKLCEKADIIIPNITEAVFILGEDYIEGPYSVKYIEDLLKKLSLIGPKKIVLTGVHFDNNSLGAVAYDAETGETSYAIEELVEGYYHGTGDVFGSALVAAYLESGDLANSTKLAVSFTTKSIKWTKEAKTDIRFGVNFENFLGEFSKEVKSL